MMERWRVELPARRSEEEREKEETDRRNSCCSRTRSTKPRRHSRREGRGWVGCLEEEEEEKEEGKERTHHGDLEQALLGVVLRAVDEDKVAEDDEGPVALVGGAQAGRHLAAGNLREGEEERGEERRGTGVWQVGNPQSGIMAWLIRAKRSSSRKKNWTL